MKMGMAAKPVPDGATEEERKFFAIIGLVSHAKEYDAKLRALIDARVEAKQATDELAITRADLDARAAVLDERDKAQQREAERLAGWEHRLTKQAESTKADRNRLGDERADFDKEAEAKRAELDRREHAIAASEVTAAARLAEAERLRSEAEGLKARYDAKVTAAARLLNEAG